MEIYRDFKKKKYRSALLEGNLYSLNIKVFYSRMFGFPNVWSSLPVGERDVPKVFRSWASVFIVGKENKSTGCQLAQPKPFPLPLPQPQPVIYADAAGVILKNSGVEEETGQEEREWSDG